jgi:UDP-N-acetyl-D-mannosaminuronic acid transferase (WecB/TagA/CpsF family)
MNSSQSAAQALVKQAVVGVGTNATSYDEVVGCCRRWIDTRRGYNSADIATPDGMPLVLVADSGAEIVFVGISTPKQERSMYADRERFPRLVMIGVGAAFDFHAGRVRKAPVSMQRNGLEWLFRLAAEPKRLWQRYLLVTPFLPLWAMQLLNALRQA